MSSLKEYLDNKNNKESNISTIPEGSTDVKDLAKLNLLPRTKLENYTEIKGIGNNPNYNLNSPELSTEDLTQTTLTSMWNSFKQGIDQTQNSNYLGKQDQYQEIIDNNIDKRNSWIKSKNLGLISEDKLNEELDKINKENSEAKKEIDDLQEDIDSNKKEISNEYVSQLYKLKEAAIQAKGGDSDLWDKLIYTQPSMLGSSASLLGSQMVATFGTGALKKLTERTAASLLGPGELTGGIATAATILGTLGELYYGRKQETWAEVGGQIEQNNQLLLEQWQKDHPNTPFETLDENTQQEILRQNRIKSRKGMDELFNKQMMLMIPDAIEATLFPGSKLLGAFKTGRNIERGIEALTGYNKYTRAAEALAKYYLGKKTEGFEEGFQYGTEKEQTNQALGIDKIQNNDINTSQFWKDLLSDSEDVLTSMQFGPFKGQGKYKNDKQFEIGRASCRERV